MSILGGKSLIHVLMCSKHRNASEDDINYNLLLISPCFSPIGHLQNGGYCDHDEDERRRFDTRAEGGQDLQQNG